MLFKFKSNAASDLIMLEPDGRALLHLMLGNDPVKGIVLVQDMPAAIDRLESALVHEAAKRQEQKQATVASEKAFPEDEKDSTVQISQRAAPMLKMLKRCLAEQSDLVWGV